MGGDNKPGLSPRGRGNRCSGPNATIVIGSIPAWAGEPNGPAACPARRPVYPRVGGGTRLERLTASDSEGLSPRGRGNPMAVVVIGSDPRSIPAWAGEPLVVDAVDCDLGVYPRVGGGTLCVVFPDVIHWGLSPRGRGNRGHQQHRNRHDRSIPAWAGEPLCPSPIDSVKQVYPRVGGGTPRHAVVRHAGRIGSIPAWAGEPLPPVIVDSKVVGLSPRGRGNRS